MRAAGGHLFLSGVDPNLLAQLGDTHRVDLEDAVTAVPATDTLLQSTLNARSEAEQWLARQTVQGKVDPT